MAYTSFNLPDSNTGLQGPAGTPKYTWQYDENHQRIKETRVNASGTRTTWMLHPDNAGGLGFECESSSNVNCDDAQTLKRHYLSAGGQTIGVLVSTGPLPSLGNQTEPPVLGTVTLNKLEYWHKDHLGSLIATSDHAGNVTARYAYDPFGKRRKTDGNYDPFGNIVVDWTGNTDNGTDRGFTGHEQLDDIGLIHMNGRIYDANLGRFLQADPMVEDPQNLQSYNRYAYLWNNPLNGTDPSGFCFICDPFKSIGSQWDHWSNVASNDRNFKIVASIAAAYFLGPAYSGFLGGGIGQAAFAGFVSGAISSGNMEGALQGAFTSAAFFGAGNVIKGGNFFSGTAAGMTPEAIKAAAWSGTGAIALHGVVGCVTSVAGGGKCSSGALSAAFSKAATVYGGVDKLDVVSGTIASAVIGGTGSVLGGGSFENGARTAAFGYLFNHCATSKDCWREAQTSFTKMMTRIFVTPFDPLKPDYATTTVGSLSGQGGAAVNLRDGSKFVAGGVAMVDPRGNSFKPGVTASVGWIWGADSAAKVNDFLGGDGGQLSVSIPTGTPVNAFVAVTKSYGGSVALEIGAANPGKLSGAISPISHAKQVGD